MIGSLFTLAGETLSAIGRMIERPAFNDEAAEQFLGGRWESDGPDAADALADLEERVEVFEPRKCSTNNSAAAMESGYDIAANLTAAFELFPQHKTSAATPDARREGPNPATPPTGLGLQTSECPGCYDFACPGPHRRPLARRLFRSQPPPQCRGNRSAPLSHLRATAPTGHWANCSRSPVGCCGPTGSERRPSTPCTWPCSCAPQHCASATPNEKCPARMYPDEANTEK